MPRVRGCRAPLRPVRGRPTPWLRRPPSPPAATFRSGAGRSRFAPCQGAYNVESLIQIEPLPRNFQPVDIPEHGRRERAVPEQVAGNALHVSHRDLLDACQCFVQTKLPIEVDLLTREMRHAARRAFE